MSITENLEQVRERIKAAEQAAGRPNGSVRLLAVSKTYPMESIQEAFRDGQTAFGENKVQELAVKEPLLKEAEWHLIGHLQSNKVRAALALAVWIHSVDSLELMKRIERIAAEDGRKAKLLLEVNVSHEESKFGMTDAEVEETVLAAQEGPCPCVGLMTVAPATASDQELHHVFGQLRELRDRMAQKTGVALPELSMGMSGDMEIAIAEGATIVRIGTAIFGARDYSKA